MFYDFEKIDTIYPLFDALENCKGVKQQPKHHPEGDVFTHSIQVLNWAFRESTDIDLIIAAMLHDVGKICECQGHDSYGAELLEGYISEKTNWLILNHMRIWYFILGDMKKLKKIKELFNNEWFADLILLARWDKLGRNPNKKIIYNRVEIIDRLTEIGSEK